VRFLYLSLVLGFKKNRRGSEKKKKIMHAPVLVLSKCDLHFFF
jgi:hypothetical protein